MGEGLSFVEIVIKKPPMNDAGFRRRRVFVKGSQSLRKAVWRGKMADQIRRCGNNVGGTPETITKRVTCTGSVTRRERLDSQWRTEAERVNTLVIIARYKRSDAALDQLVNKVQ